MKPAVPAWCGIGSRAALGALLYMAAGASMASGAVASPAVFLLGVVWYYPLVYAALLLGLFRHGVPTAVATAITALFNVFALAIVFASVDDLAVRGGGASTGVAFFVAGSLLVTTYALLAPIAWWWAVRHGRPRVRRALLWLMATQLLVPFAWVGYQEYDDASYREQGPQIEALGRSARTGELPDLMRTSALREPRYLSRFATGLAQSELIGSDRPLVAEDEAAIRDIARRMPAHHMAGTTLRAKLTWDAVGDDWEALIDAFAANRLLDVTGLEFIARHAAARHCLDSDAEILREAVRRRLRRIHLAIPKDETLFVEAICGKRMPERICEPFGDPSPANQPQPLTCRWQ